MTARYESNLVVAVIEDVAGLRRLMYFDIASRCLVRRRGTPVLAEPSSLVWGEL